MAETKITNGDRIRKMTNEELAEMLHKGYCENCAYRQDDCTDITCEEGILEYLNQEVAT